MSKQEHFGLPKMIRKYQKQDTSSVIAVWRSASALAHPFLSESFMDETETAIREKYLPNTETWIAEKEGQVIGFISLFGNEVGALFLLPEFHGKGLGRKLMNKAASLHSELLVEVFKENMIGRKFYERYGFRLMKEYTHEPTGQPVLRLVFR